MHLVQHIIDLCRDLFITLNISVDPGKKEITTKNIGSYKSFWHVEN